MSTRRSLSGDARAHLREVQRGVRDVLRDLRALKPLDAASYSVIHALEDADSVFAAALATPTNRQQNRDMAASIFSVLTAACALADYGVHLQETHAVKSMSLQLMGLSLVRSLRTFVCVGCDEHCFDEALLQFEDLPHGDFSSWLNNRIDQARSKIDEALSEFSEESLLAADVAV